jgi:hypothetical protein
MKNEIRLISAGVLSLFLIAAVWAIPPAAHNFNSTSTAAALQQDVPQAPLTKSASGTISKVEETSFTIAVPPSPTVKSSGPSAQEDTPKTMIFQVDKNTIIDGKLEIGANADVTYRDDSSGNHVAVGVRVTPPKS